MSNIRLGTSPLTGNIFAGKLNKAGTMWLAGKQDVTEEAIGCVIQHLNHDESNQVVWEDGNGKLLELKIVAS